MYIVPFAFHTSLSEDAIKEFECSDKVYVHMETFSTILGSSNSGELVILELKSKYDLGLPIAVTIGGFHSFEDKDCVYGPSWVVEHIGCLENSMSDDKTMCEVSFKRINPSLCSKITLQPFESKLSSYSDPESALRNGLEKYSCIYANSTIRVLMPDNYELKFSIYDCEPKKSDEPLCLRDVEVLVNLLPAKDIIIPESKKIEACGGAGISNKITHETEETTPFYGYSKIDPKSKSKFAPKGYVPFSGVGYTLGSSNKKEES